MKKLLALVFCCLSSLHAGVYVVADAPEEVEKIVQEIQEEMVLGVEEYNTEHDDNFIFEPGKFSSHISFAFVSQDELSITQAEEQYDGLVPALQDIAAENASVEIAENFQKSTLEFWPGKFEVECGGSKKKNYVNMVLKASKNQKLEALVSAITGYLEKKHKVKQRFPFSAHFTLGRLCRKNDAYVDSISHPQVMHPLHPSLLRNLNLRGTMAAKKHFIFLVPQ